MKLSHRGSERKKCFHNVNGFRYVILIKLLTFLQFCQTRLVLILYARERLAAKGINEKTIAKYFTNIYWQSNQKDTMQESKCTENYTSQNTTLKTVEKIMKYSKKKT